MRKHIILLLVPLIFLSYQCEPDHETVEVSKVSELPKFEYIGGQFVSFIKGSQPSYTDPGVIATVDEQEVRVISFSPDTIKTNNANVYVIFYFAQNDDNLISEGRRIVAITHEDVSNNDDLEGKYLTTAPLYGWPAVEAKVRKKNNKGWYSCSEIMGFPGVEIKGEFVDIGQGELYLLPGESYFGDYDISEGRYTLSSLEWSIYLLDDPYTGIEVEVLLIKQDE